MTSSLEPTETTGGTSSKATFAGRLKLDDFAFKSGASSSPSVRRSSRLASVSATASTTPNSEHEPPSDESASPKKRQPASSSPSPSKKRQKSRSTPSGYAHPSTYAHLSPLTDRLGPNLLVLFVGLNPGVQTARSGHAYAHPSNLFWKLLYSSGVTPRACRPEEDADMPRLFSLGLTNIVSRPSRNGAELSRSEMDDGVAILEEKVRTWKPESVCIVGKSIWESIWRVRHGKSITKKQFKYGWQNDSLRMGLAQVNNATPSHSDDTSSEYGGESSWQGARVFVASSTSGLAATLSPAQKESIWRELGIWVEEQRAERLAASTNSKPAATNA